MSFAVLSKVKTIQVISHSLDQLQVLVVVVISTGEEWCVLHVQVDPVCVTVMMGMECARSLSGRAACWTVGSTHQKATGTSGRTMQWPMTSTNCPPVQLVLPLAPLH